MDDLTYVHSVVYKILQPKVLSEGNQKLTPLKRLVHSLYSEHISYKSTAFVTEVIFVVMGMEVFHSKCRQLYTYE